MLLHEEVHGRLRHKGEIENEAIAALRKWLPYYLRVAAEQHEFGALATPKTYGVVSDFDVFPEQGLPAVIVMADDSISAERDGRGYYTLTHPLNIVVVFAAASAQVARDAAHIYGAAVAAAILQKAGQLADDMLVTRYTGNASRTLDTTVKRTTVAVEHGFVVQMDKVVSDLLGPDLDEPPEEIPTDLPEITDVDVEATHVADGS
jgi:hypothetical protein